MVSSTHPEGLVSEVRLSSVVPGTMTSENTVHELTSMDLVMKLHYLKAVYFFKSEAVEGVDVADLKKAMFPLLDLYYPAAGRIRRSEDGRPLIKCNDTGVRIAEARASKTIDEWLEMDDCSLDDHLIYNQVLGPDLAYSPFVFMQFTRFTCGGLSVGLNWAHILGDAFTASAFINTWGQNVEGHTPIQSLLHNPNRGKEYQFPSLIPGNPFSLKRVESVGDYWLTTTNCKMETLSLHVTAKQLDQFLSKISGLDQAANVQPFQALTAVIWKSLAKVRGESYPRIVTLCTNNLQERRNGILSNSQLISTIQADFMVAKANALELVKLIAEKRVEESGVIEELVERDNGKSDFMVYGANLTFVNLEEAKIYGLEMKGHKPVFANYTMMGVGDEGVVLVLPEPENGNNEGPGGRIVTAVLPDNQIGELKNELKRELGIL